MLDPSRPLVTIITPAHNQAAFIQDTIDSVLGQDYPRLEYIVLDDGSTDETASVVAPQGTRLRFESHKNMGEAKTVNRGLEMASGEIIAVVNADDPLLPGAVSTAVQFLDEHPDVLVAYPDWVRIDSQTRSLGTVEVPKYDYAYMVANHACVVGPGAFFRRRAIDLIKGRDPQFRFVSDFDFWLRLGLHGPFARIPKTLAMSREHKGSTTTGARGIRMATEHIRLIKKLFSATNLPADVRRLRRRAMSRAHFVAAICCGNHHLARFKHVLLFALWYPPNFFDHWRKTRRRRR